MKSINILKDVLKLLKRNKRQSILTSLAIAIATLVVLLVLSSASYTLTTLKKDMKVSEETASLTFLSHDKRNIAGFNVKDKELVEKELGKAVELISSSYDALASAKVKETTHYLTFKTVEDLEINAVSKPKIIIGKSLEELVSSENQIAVSDKALENLTRQVDVKEYLGKKINLAGKEYEIASIYKSSAIKEVVPSLIVSDGIKITILKGEVFYDEIIIPTNDRVQITKILGLLDGQGTNKDKGNYDFIDNQRVYEDTRDDVNTMLNFIALIASVSIFVAGFGVMNSMLSSVSERVKEIAIRRALGAKKKDIYLAYIVEGTLLSIIGGLIGIGLSLGFVAIINAIGVATTLSTMQIAITFVSTAVVGIIFSVVPAMVAANKNIVEGIK